MIGQYTPSGARPRLSFAHLLHQFADQESYSKPLENAVISRRTLQSESSSASGSRDSGTSGRCPGVPERTCRGP